jgi:L-fuculose-phosphate aldolase
MQDEAALRQEVIATALSMSRQGLSPGRSGNVSARWRDGLLITPTGMEYESLSAADIVFAGPEGKLRAGSRLPSSERSLHAAIYAAKQEVNAIVHSHSLNATALACARKNIPAFHYMVAVAGGADIPLAPYATFGTEALAAAVAATLTERKACLMAHHGQIATGVDLRQALDLAGEVETLSAQYRAVLQLGAVHLIGAAEMRRVIAKFATYGQQAEPGAVAVKPVARRGVRRKSS